MSASLPKLKEHTFTRWRETAYGHWAHPGQRPQSWATATLKIASLPLSLFAEIISGATPPVTEQK